MTCCNYNFSKLLLTSILAFGLTTSCTAQKSESPSVAIELQKIRQTSVSGTIMCDSLPVANALITVKRTKTHAKSDQNGFFEIKAKQRDVLVVSVDGLATSEFVISDYFNGIIIIMNPHKKVSIAEPQQPQTLVGEIVASIGGWFSK